MTDPDERTPQEKFAGLDAMSAEQDRLHKERMDELQAKADAEPNVRLGYEALRRERTFEVIDEQLGPIADSVVASVLDLAEQLRELDLLSDENPGTPRWRVDLGTDERVAGIDADHPNGPRLYSRDRVDTVVATRPRSDGRYEHAVIDEYGMPTEWRPLQPGLALSRTCRSGWADQCLVTVMR